MAGKKLSELTTTTTLADSDLVYVVTGTSTKISKGITKANLASEITDALDAQNVKLTGNQTIGGVKTFSVNTVIDGMYIGAKTGAGLQNTVLGNLAGNALTTGATSNTLVGYNSGTSITTGSENTTLGKFAGWGITTGAGNLILGQSTAAGLTTGNNNTIIGSNISGLSTTLTNNIILANGTGAIKAQHDGTNWAFASDLTVTGDVTATNLSGTNTGDSQTLADGVSDVTATATELNLLDGLTATTAELNFVSGVTSNVQTQLGTKQNISEKNAVSGYAGLDGSGKINSSQLPSIAITDTFVVASQAAMLALTVEVGDVAVRTDIEKTFILRVDGATVLANWTELQTPTDAVSSVFGRSGVVTAQSNDYTWNQVNKATSSLADITTRNFSDLQNKPTTVAGYGITDVYTETEADAKYLLNTTDTLTGDLTVTGNVGIGTASPAQNFVVADATLGNGIELVPAGTGTIQAYNRGTSLYNTLNIDSLSNRIRSINETVFNNGAGFPESMRITSGGNVGIGTVSPSGALHVKSSTATTTGMVRLQNAMDNNYETLRVESLGNYDAHIGFLANGTSAYWWGIGIDYSDSGKFKISGDNILSVNPRLTIDTSGNVGIGTTSPLNKLVVSGIDTNAELDGTTVTQAALQLSNSDEAYGTFFGTQSSGTGLIQQRRQSSAVYYDLGINPYGGNVGIGTVTPQSKLQVNGGIQMADDTALASASKVGTMRYRADANNSYAEMVMQTAAATYAWVVIKTNTW